MNRFSEINLVEASLRRCLLKEGFISQFYFELCNIHPAAYCHLSGPEFETYKNNLYSTIEGILEFGKGHPSGEKALSAMVNVETGIAKDTAPYWEQALLITIAANDERLDQETSEAWRSLIQTSLDFILKQRNFKKAA
jgi:hypothetical protein